MAHIMFLNTENEEGTIKIHAKVYKDNRLIREREKVVNITPNIVSVSVGYTPENDFDEIKTEDQYNGK